MVQSDAGIVMKGYADVKGDGADQKMSQVIGGTNPFTFEAVINPNGGTDLNMIASKGDNCSAFRISENAVYFFVKDSSGWKSVKSRVLTDAELHSYIHVAGIYDGSRISAYLEGEELVSQPAGAVEKSDFPLGIGYCPEKNRKSVSSFREFRLYSKALTKAELDGRSVKPTDSGVVLWYDFNEVGYAGRAQKAEGVRFLASDFILEKGKKATVRAEVKPFYVTGGVTYESSDPSIAEVDAASGEVTAVKPGTTVIRAKCQEDGTLTAEIKVTVPEEQQDPKPPVKPQKKLLAVGKTFNSGIFRYKVTKTSKTSAKNRRVRVEKLLDKKKTSITIPATVKKNGYTYQVTAVQKNVFQKNKKLKTVKIGANITKIGEKGFYQCSKLKTI